jgi:oligoendopeptidase F
LQNFSSSLYRKYREEGPAFIPVLEDILSDGGSRSPVDAAKLAGIDLEDPGFCQKGYDFLRELIEELKGLVEG